MYDFIEDKDVTIVRYRDNRIRICKELGHWKYLTLEEKIRFKNSTNINEIDRLMITSRQRSP